MVRWRQGRHTLPGARGRLEAEEHLSWRRAERKGSGSGKGAGMHLSARDLLCPSKVQLTQQAAGIF